MSVFVSETAAICIFNSLRTTWSLEQLRLQSQDVLSWYVPRGGLVIFHDNFDKNSKWARIGTEVNVVKNTYNGVEVNKCRAMNFTLEYIAVYWFIEG